MGTSLGEKKVGTGSGMGLREPTSRKCSEKWGTRFLDLRLSLFECLDCRGFVVFHVENGVELGDLKQVVHFLGEV